MATASNNYVQRGCRIWLCWDTLGAHTSTLGPASWVVRMEYRVTWPPWTGHLGHFGPPCVCVCVCVCRWEEEKGREEGGGGGDGGKEGKKEEERMRQRKCSWT